jgi:hypothetical protein
VVLRPNAGVAGLGLVQRNRRWPSIEAVGRCQTGGLSCRQLFRCRHRRWVVDASQPDVGDNRSTAEEHRGRVVDLHAVMVIVAGQRHSHRLIIEPRDAVLDCDGGDVGLLTEADRRLAQPGGSLIRLRETEKVGAETEGVAAVGGRDLGAAGKTSLASP